MTVLIYCIWLVLFIIPLWRICERAGFGGQMALIALIPWFGPLIVGLILSFADWPAKKPTVRPSIGQES